MRKRNTPVETVADFVEPDRLQIDPRPIGAGPPEMSRLPIRRHPEELHFEGLFGCIQISDPTRGAIALDPVKVTDGAPLCLPHNRRPSCSMEVQHTKVCKRIPGYETAHPTHSAGASAPMEGVGDVDQVDRPLKPVVRRRRALSLLISGDKSILGISNSQHCWRGIPEPAALGYVPNIAHSNPKIYCATRRRWVTVGPCDAIYYATLGCGKRRRLNG